MRSGRWRARGWIGVAIGVGMLAASVRAGEVRVAVAANFTGAAEEVARAFERASAHRVVLASGATGLLFAQITQGAPFEVLLAADAERPAELARRGLSAAASGGPATYALGTLVLYSRDPARVTGPETLREGRFERLAIANPVTAPYGAAAMAVLESLGVRAELEPRLVRGASVAQAYQFVFTGSAELGLVALSQVRQVRQEKQGNASAEGSRWVVPRELHPPIRQDVVLLAPGQANAAARAFVAFLLGEPGRAIIEHHGYGLPERE